VNVVLSAGRGRLRRRRGCCQQRARCERR